MRGFPVFALAALMPFAARAQTDTDLAAAQPQDSATPAQTSGPSGAGDQTQVPPAYPAVLVAGLSGGVVARGSAVASPFATLSLARYKGPTYLRVDLTGYRSVLRQFDTALPSKFYIASFGAGGNWHDWTLDGYASIGTQQFGGIKTPTGVRASTAGNSSGYFGVGARAGRIFRQGTHWYAVPTIAVQYVATDSLRFRFDHDGLVDFQIPDRSFSVSAALRAGYLFGQDRTGYVGLGVEHFISDNGLTAWQLAYSQGRERAVAVLQADGWTQLSASGTIPLGHGLWLDAEVRQGLGMLAGDTTTAMLGLRLRL